MESDQDHTSKSEKHKVLETPTNPNTDRAVARLNSEWKQFSNRDEDLDKCLIRWGGYTYPYIEDFDFFCFSTLLWYFMFLIHDYFEGHPKDNSEWNTIIKNKDVGGRTGFIEDMYRFLMSKFRFGNGKHDQLFYEMWQKNVEDVINLFENDFQEHIDGDRIISYDEFLDKHMTDLCVWVFFVIIELSCGISLDEPVHHDQTLTEFTKQCGHYCIMANDIGSHKKDNMMANNGLNLVSIKMKEDGVSEERAIELITDEMDNREVQIEQLAQQLTKNSDHRVDKYVQGAIACYKGYSLLVDIFFDILDVI